MQSIRNSQKLQLDNLRKFFSVRFNLVQGVDHSANLVDKSVQSLSNICKYCKCLQFFEIKETTYTFITDIIYFTCMYLFVKKTFKLQLTI